MGLSSSEDRFFKVSELLYPQNTSSLQSYFAIANSRVLLRGSPYSDKVVLQSLITQ